MRAHRGGLLVGVVTIVLLAGVIPAAEAVTTTVWSGWQPLSGTAGSYTTSVQVAARPFVSAAVSTTSRSGQVGVISGASTWLAEGTPVGAKYGSSLNQSYLNLRPKADNTASPSLTTYSFATPTPASGWTFVLGDIDADSVRIQAVAADGHLLGAAELGYRGGFNYCAPGVVGKPSCTGDAADVPIWDPDTLTLTGNAAAADTSGSAGWFEPSTPILSLSFIFTRRAGFPVYQTWFASIARDVGGTVTDLSDGPADGVTVTLTDVNGATIATTTTTASGTYSFLGIVATDGYTVRVAPPDGKIADGTATRVVNLTDTDGVADFTIRDVIPVSVGGRVTDTAGHPVAGAVVAIEGMTTTTDTDGRYVFDQVPVGTHTATVTAPAGYAIEMTAPPFTIPPGSETPITGIDFRVIANPTLSGAVRSTGDGIAGVTVTVSGPEGLTRTAITDTLGRYSFPRLPSGEYVVRVQPPPGYAPAGAVERTEILTDADVPDVDFNLARLGSVDGTVRANDGLPIPGVVVTIDGPDGQQRQITDGDGAYGLGALTAGTYTITVTSPPGSDVVGPATRTVIITASGEVFIDQDFTLTEKTIVPPPSTPPPPVTGSGTTGDSQLPATGLAPAIPLWASSAAAAALAVGIVLLMLTRRRTTRRA